MQPLTEKNPAHARKVGEFFIGFANKHSILIFAETGQGRAKLGEKQNHEISDKESNLVF